MKLRHASSASTQLGALGILEMSSLVSMLETEEQVLIGFAYGTVRNREVAEDLIQEAVLELHDRWSEIENPVSWIYRTVHNRALEYRNCQGARSSGNEADSANGLVSNEKLLGQLTAVGLVRLLYSELDAQDRRVVEMKYLEGLSYSRIASSTGLSVNDVGYRLSEFLKKAAECLRLAEVPCIIPFPSESL